MSKSQKRRELYNYSRIGVNNSLIEVQVLQIIEKIIGRKLGIGDLVGTREITRLSGYYSNPETFIGQINLRSLETNFRFCWRETLTRWLSSENFWARDEDESKENTIQLYPQQPKVSLIICEGWVGDLRSIRHFIRKSGSDSFQEHNIDIVEANNPQLWGGIVPEAIR